MAVQLRYIYSVTNELCNVICKKVCVATCKMCFCNIEVAKYYLTCADKPALTVARLILRLKILAK